MSSNSGKPIKTPFYTVAGIAQWFDVSERTVHRWIASGELIVHRLGRSVRISDTDLKAFQSTRRSEE